MPVLCWRHLSCKNSRLFWPHGDSLSVLSFLTHSTWIREVRDKTARDYPNRNKAAMMEHAVWSPWWNVSLFSQCGRMGETRERPGLSAYCEAIPLQRCCAFGPVACQKWLGNDPSLKPDHSSIKHFASSIMPPYNPTDPSIAATAKYLTREEDMM